MKPLLLLLLVICSMHCIGQLPQWKPTDSTDIIYGHKMIRASGDTVFMEVFYYRVQKSDTARNGMYASHVREYTIVNNVRVDSSKEFFNWYCPSGNCLNLDDKYILRNKAKTHH